MMKRKHREVCNPKVRQFGWRNNKRHLRNKNFLWTPGEIKKGQIWYETQKPFEFSHQTCVRVDICEVLFAWNFVGNHAENCSK